MKAIFKAWAWHQLARVGLGLVRGRIRDSGYYAYEREATSYTPIPTPYVGWRRVAQKEAVADLDLTRQYREALTAYADTAEALTMARRGK
jgi:hypothetical protein